MFKTYRNCGTTGTKQHKHFSYSTSQKDLDLATVVTIGAEISLTLVFFMKQ